VQIAVLTFDGFNELDSFIAAAILNRVKAKGWKAHITSPFAEVTSMNGITVQRQQPLEFAREADAVIIGSGVKTREIAADAALLSRIKLDPTHGLKRGGWRLMAIRLTARDGKPGASVRVDDVLIDPRARV